MRQQLVVQARPLLLKPDYDTVAKGMPLPSSSEAEADENGGGSKREGEVQKENGLDAKEEDRLDWGPEGEEAPLLASGKPILNICFRHAMASPSTL